MPTSFANLLYLGNHADIDPNGSELNNTAEDAHDLLNTPFASGPMKIATLAFNDNNNGGFVEEDDGGAAALTGDTISYDLGAGSTTQVLDSHVWYRADVTLEGGSVLTNVNVSVIQMQNGDLFLTDFSGSTLDGQAIADVELKTVVNDSFARISAPPQSLVGTTVVCFTPGTLIAVPGGERPVEELSIGDPVWTADSGHQPIVRIHVTEHHAAGLHAPVQFTPGAIGPGAPARPLAVSPQHRILCRSRLVERMFGTDEVLVPAKRFLCLPGVRSGDPDAPVRYIHLEVEPHAILRANGALVESCLRGEQMCKTLPPALRRVLQPVAQADACRLIPEGRRQKKMVERLAKNAAMINDGGGVGAPMTA